MKNIKLFLTSIIIGLSLSAHAQIQIGVKAIYGTSYNKEVTEEFVNINPLRVHNITALQSDARVGLGLSLYAANEKLFFISDVQYVISGDNYILNSSGISRTPLDPAERFESNDSDLRLTVSSGYTYKNFKFGVGPEFSYSLSKTETLSQIDEIQAIDEKFRAGFNFLIGYKFLDHIHLDLKHTFMFNDVSSEFTYLGVPLAFESNQKFIELNLAYYF